MFSAVHADTDDAIAIYQDTRCERAVGMHWGTWILTEEEVMEPKERLEELCAEKGVQGFGTVDIGGFVEV
jgi:L-ascorbate metabolism protein UlaG (beta-lactamase superfamily)